MSSFSMSIMFMLISIHTRLVYLMVLAFMVAYNFFQRFTYDLYSIKEIPQLSTKQVSVDYLSFRFITTLSSSQLHLD